MMRALLAGERRVTLLQALGLFALLCLLASNLGLTLDYRHQIREFKGTIYSRCLQRQTYDRSNHDAVLAQEQLYSTLLQISREQPIPPSTDPKVAALYHRQVAALNLAQQKTRAAARRGVIGSCAIYK